MGLSEQNHMKFLRPELTFIVKKPQGYLINFFRFKTKQKFQVKKHKAEKKIEQMKKYQIIIMFHHR